MAFTTHPHMLNFYGIEQERAGSNQKSVIIWDL